MISDGIIAGAKAVYPSSFIYRGIFLLNHSEKLKSFAM